MSTPAVLIYNPAAGRRRAGDRLGELLPVLARGGFAVEPMPTTAPGDATRLARAAAEEGRAEVAFVLGGDGTLREAARGLLGSGVALAPLPGGTANVLARALGLPPHPLAAAAALARGTRRSLDVGLCGDQPFLMMASAGLDAAVMSRQDGALKARLGRGAILLRGLAQWWRYPYPEIELTADGRPRRATLAVACNIPLYGGGFRMAPAARFDDRRLDLVLFRGRGPLPTLRFVLQVLAGRHAASREVEILPVERARLLGPPDLPVQIDGDPCPAPLPLDIRLAPRPLQVLVPGREER